MQQHKDHQGSCQTIRFERTYVIPTQHQNPPMVDVSAGFLWLISVFNIISKSKSLDVLFEVVIDITGQTLAYFCHDASKTAIAITFDMIYLNSKLWKISL